MSCSLGLGRGRGGPGAGSGLDRVGRAQSELPGRGQRQGQGPIGIRTGGAAARRRCVGGWGFELGSPGWVSELKRGWVHGWESPTGVKGRDNRDQSCTGWGKVSDAAESELGKSRATVGGPRVDPETGPT